MSDPRGDGRENTFSCQPAMFYPSDVRRWPRRKKRFYIQTSANKALGGLVPDLIVRYEGPSKIVVRSQRCDLRGWF